jgi:hypothetical protein
MSIEIICPSCGEPSGAPVLKCPSCGARTSGARGRAPAQAPVAPAAAPDPDLDFSELTALMDPVGEDITCTDLFPEPLLAGAGGLAVTAREADPPPPPFSMVAPILLSAFAVTAGLLAGAIYVGRHL